MKCLKNSKTGNVIRVKDEQATQMVGSTWSFVSKDEWRKFTSPKFQDVDIQHDMGGSYEIKKEKKKTSKKVK